MTRLARAIVAVMLGTVAAGVIGGLVGLAIGWISPAFVAWLYAPDGRIPPPSFEPERFAAGLGAVCGLFFGAGTSLLLALALVLRDAITARPSSK
jgi:hypothetical protein